MGHRATLVLVDAGDYELYYGHWCSNSLPEQLFWGPEPGMQFIRSQQPVEQHEWLDTTWAEGGVVCDLDSKQLLLFGGQSMLYDIPLRRLYMELIRLTWTGWRIGWADNQMIDLAEYMEVDRALVFPDNKLDSYEGPFTIESEIDWTPLILSVLDEHSVLRLYPSDGSIDCVLEKGPALVDMARSQPSYTELDLTGDRMEFPQSGIHIDVARRRLSYWWSSEVLPLDLVQQAWPGWTVTPWYDEFELHLEQLDGTVTLLQRSPDQLLAHLRSILMQDSNSAIASFASMVDIMRTEGHDVEVNPNAMEPESDSVPLDRRATIFDEVVARWRASHRALPPASQ